MHVLQAMAAMNGVKGLGLKILFNVVCVSVLLVKDNGTGTNRIATGPDVEHLSL